MDYLEHELSKEVQNGRFARLLCKIGFITERPESGAGAAQSERWSETGDRYLIKLFRDFVFHQQHSDGSPVVDFGHVANALAKVNCPLPPLPLPLPVYLFAKSILTSLVPAHSWMPAHKRRLF